MHASTLKYVVLCANEPGLYADKINALIRESRHKCLGIAIVPFIPPTLKTHFLRFIWNFYGFTGFGKKIIASIFGRLRGLTFVEIARRNNLPFRQFDTPNGDLCISWLKGLQPDLVLNLQPFRLKTEVLQTAKLGFLNKHSSLLPAYRGVFPVFWALLHNEKELGISIHEMNLDYDGGPIYYQQEIAVEPGKTFQEIYDQLDQLIVEGFQTAMDRKADPQYQPLSNPSSAGKYFGYPSRHDIKRFFAAGFR